MYRIRFHGRGGQGVKTTSRVLGSAFFIEGFEVQDAPRYGAERRGAPIFAYVRADRVRIHERGVIYNPDLVVVVDDSVVPVPAADVLAGIDAHSVFLILSREPAEVWRDRIKLPCKVVTLPVPDGDSGGLAGATCAGAAARLIGVVSRGALEQAIEEELGSLGTEVVERNVTQALGAFDRVRAHEGSVREGEPLSAERYRAPEWVDLPSDPAGLAAPAIHARATSVEVRTGLWRTLRPVIDDSRCKGCWWICTTLCPDGAMPLQGGRPTIDYDHCKGCMICVVQCPSHAIEAVPEQGTTSTGVMP